MQGVWKENVSGYDRKGNKRKKQNRKHLLKDKAKWHIKHTIYNKQIASKKSNRTYIEGDIDFTPPMVKNNRELYVDVWVVDIDNYNYSKSLGEYCFIIPDGHFEGNNRTAFEYNNSWYDIYTKKIIKGIIKPLTKIDTIYLDWDENKPKIVEYHGYCGAATKETIFLYGKPLPVKFWNIFGFYATKDRKYAQKKVNHIDRQNLRTYIAKGDWDVEIKTHALSKSIAWEIY